MSRAFTRKTQGADTATRQMLNKPPLPFTKGLRLGNMPQIRVIVDEELESVWTGKKTPQQALDTAVERGNQLLRRFEKSTEVLISVMSDAFRLSDLGIACRPDKRSASGTVQELTVMSSSRPVFRSRWLPYLLVAPQLIITVIFFIWPAGEALWYSLQSVDPFGFSSQFVGPG